ncbi:hypothetical protein TNCT_265721 [Trichonephila clavata]|uniref:Uncharacterized protein n=1 Tax=Trichonephila clavata TaxID=2740835 RepID=A0A8X6L5Q7_TRICU|nr:hypothetical protein TNCT_265721 [Trichonephila clavata]
MVAELRDGQLFFATGCQQKERWKAYAGLDVYQTNRNSFRRACLLLGSCEMSGLRERMDLPLSFGVLFSSLACFIQEDRKIRDDKNVKPGKAIGFLLFWT